MCALPIYSAVVTDDGEYLLVVSSEGTDERYGLTLHPIGKPGAQPITLVDDYANNWEYVTNAEIGRASCRERVCQYVSISVVAVSLKQQQYNIQVEIQL